MIDELIEKKAQGNSFQINNIKMKLMFKGIIPDDITNHTPDTEENQQEMIWLSSEPMYM